MLMVFIWLRQYSREQLLAAYFEISTNTVSRDIHFIIPLIWSYFRDKIQWPNHEWLQLAGNWEDFPNAVGVDPRANRSMNVLVGMEGFTAFQRR